MMKTTMMKTTAIIDVIVFVGLACVGMDRA